MGINKVSNVTFAETKMATFLLSGVTQLMCLLIEFSVKLQCFAVALKVLGIFKVSFLNPKKEIHFKWIIDVVDNDDDEHNKAFSQLVFFPLLFIV